MIEIDGSFGEGGGQILRSSVALSAITGNPVAITNIRANRKRPGLMRQHFAAISAAKEICDADVEGLELHSTALTFSPQKVRAGKYKFSIGTAGSTSLVFQTVLLPLLLADDKSELTLCGGTHNPMAPPFDFIEKCYLPQLQRMGANVSAKLECYGFAPAGGGEVFFQIDPVEQWRPLNLLTRGDQKRRTVRAVSSGLPASIANRELKRIQSKTKWPWEELRGETVQSGGPGNIVSIELEYEKANAIFTGFGRIGRRAELVATDALREARIYIDSEAPACEHLADQLLLPMAVAAHRVKLNSRFMTHMISSHTQTHIKLLQHFMDVTIDVDAHADNQIEVLVAPYQTD